MITIELFPDSALPIGYDEEISICSPLEARVALLKAEPVELRAQHLKRNPKVEQEHLRQLGEENVL